MTACFTPIDDRSPSISLEMRRWFFASFSAGMKCCKALLGQGFSPYMQKLHSIDAVEKIAQTRILSLYCVDALRGMGLRGVVVNFAEPIYTSRVYCVDLTLETPAPSGLPDELPTDWVKSD